MTKLQILQVILVTWCILIYTTPADAIENEDQFVQMMETKVINPFRLWIKSYRETYNQFGVLLMMDSNTDWKSFCPSPTICEEKNCEYYDVYSKKYKRYNNDMRKERVQPYQRGSMLNYIAALPLRNKNKNNKNEHSEDRVLQEFSLLLHQYKGRNSNNNPKAVVLYTYYLPCRDCTDIITEFYTKNARLFKVSQPKIDFIVAYSDDTYPKLEVDYTIQKFKEKKIELVKVPYPDNYFKSFIKKIKFMSRINRE